jgi:hypothetical protein
MQERGFGMDQNDAFHVTATFNEDRPAPTLVMTAVIYGDRSINPKWKPASLKEMRCVIEYRDAMKPPSRRSVTLHSIRNSGTAPLIEATCHTNGPGRNFRLDRIARITTENGAQHDPLTFLRDHFGIEVTTATA